MKSSTEELENKEREIASQNTLKIKEHQVSIGTLNNKSMMTNVLMQVKFEQGMIGKTGG